MAAPTLPVLSPFFSTALGRALDREIDALQKAVIRAEAHTHLTQCWYEDDFCCCAERAVVHQLGTDYEYCLRHFQKIEKENR